MTAYIRNPLTYVWVFLTTSTIASWWISHGVDIDNRMDTTVTSVVLLIAAVKSRFVIRYFMEVRYAPTWLKIATDGWLILVFLLLLIVYLAIF